MFHRIYVTCPRCDGEGIINRYMHVPGAHPAMPKFAIPGLCFQCRGDCEVPHNLAITVKRAGNAFHVFADGSRVAIVNRVERAEIVRETNEALERLFKGKIVPQGALK